eukprot:GHVS01082167.1.p1 GENE.GHVS01082167.1~~GHVS01082167.1.p1  ORF type:complete len:969 (+),score=102.62 GHVS01082167.1:142-3048(+)
MQLMGQTFFNRWFPLFHASPPLWFLCLCGLLVTVPPNYLRVDTSLHQLNIWVAAERVGPGRPLLLSSWFGAPIKAAAKAVPLSTEESIGEGVLFFVLPDGKIDSCDDTNSTSLIEFLLRGYSASQLSPPLHHLVTRNESVADLSISRRQLKSLHSPLEPETPSTINDNVDLLPNDETTTATNNPLLTSIFGRNTPSSLRQKAELNDEESAPKRSLARGSSEGLPLISSYHYMTPQRARTGWTAAVAPYGMDGMGSGASVSLVNALGQTVDDLPPSVAYRQAAAPEKLDREEPRLSGLQLADREYTKQQAEDVDGLPGVSSRRLQGMLGSLLQSGAPLFGDIAAALTTALNGILAPSNSGSPIDALSSLVSNGLRAVDSSSRLADIFPHRVTANAKEETFLSSSAAMGEMATAVGSMGRELLPSLLELTGPLVSEIARLLMQQAGPIGSYIVESMVRQTSQAINSGDPDMRRAVEGLMGMAEDFLRPMVESAIQGQFRSQYSPRYRAQLVEDMNEVMRSNLGTLTQSISGMLSKELPTQLQGSMAATMNTAVRQSLRQVLDDSMPRHVRNVARETGSKIQQEVRDLLADPSSFVTADTIQALLKEISRTTTRSVRRLIQNMGDNSGEMIVGNSEREPGPMDSDALRRRARRAREISEAEDEERQRQLEDEKVRKRRQLNEGDVGAMLKRNRLTASGQVGPLFNDVAKTLDSWLTRPGDQRQETDKVISETLGWDRLTELYRNTANQALTRFSLEQQRSAFGQTGQDRSAPTEELSTYERVMQDAHNTYRKNAGLGAVQWDSALATYIVNHMKSQDAYKNCKMEHSKQSQRDNIGVFTNIGENLYTGWGGTIFPKAERIVEAWYDEINCYRYGRVGAPCTKNPNPQCARITGFTGNNPLTGHFTQLMWSSVTHIGCGAIECSSYKGPGKKFFGGCSYGSKISGYGGNMVGEYPFDSRTAIRLGLPVGTCN